MVRIERQVGIVRRVVYFANGDIRRTPAHMPMQNIYDSLFSRTTIKVDRYTHFTVRNYSDLEFGKEHTIDRLTLTKGGHTRTVCAFEFEHQKDNPNYRYAVISPSGLVGYMWGKTLYDFDLAIAHVLNPSDTKLSAKVLTTGMGMDESVKAFLMAEQAEAKIHGKHPIKR